VVGVVVCCVGGVMWCVGGGAGALGVGGGVGKEGGFSQAWVYQSTHVSGCMHNAPAVPRKQCLRASASGRILSA